jgi:tRNA-dihydrouridine synthase
MLAPMQGLTNRGLRRLFARMVQPDVVFTEFIQVRKSGPRVISAADCLEVQDQGGLVPLVVQLIGADRVSLSAAAEQVQAQGGFHININLGCPYGRMGKKAAGGALLQQPAALEDILRVLRPVIDGSFSLKVRAGFSEPEELYRLLPLFEDCGVDFLVVHARAVAQRYSGMADHSITAEVVRRTRLPVIANGDICTKEYGLRVLEESGAAGLMLGRGAIGDPYLFNRLRGTHPAVSTASERCREVYGYLQELVWEYQGIFCGEQQVLAKVKEVLAYIPDPELTRTVRQLRKAKTIKRFMQRLAVLQEA